MAFTDNEVGIERGATKFSPSREPRVMDRYQEGGPVRASTRSLTGSVIGVEYQQDSDDVYLELFWPHISESEASTLRTLANESGPVTVKIEKGVSDTLACLFGELKLDPLVGHYPESAPAPPSIIRRWRAEVTLLRLE